MTDADGRPVRRVYVRHTSGPYPGLRQLIGLMYDTGVYFYHTDESRPFGQQGNGDTLNRVLLWPDARMATLLRMKGNNSYVLYQEQQTHEPKQASEGDSDEAGTEVSARPGPGATPDGDTLSTLQGNEPDRNKWRLPKLW